MFCADMLYAMNADTMDGGGKLAYSKLKTTIASLECLFIRDYQVLHQKIEREDLKKGTKYAPHETLTTDPYNGSLQPTLQQTLTQ